MIKIQPVHMYVCTYINVANFYFFMTAEFATRYTATNTQKSTHNKQTNHNINNNNDQKVSRNASIIKEGIIQQSINLIANSYIPHLCMLMESRFARVVITPQLGRTRTTTNNEQQFCKYNARTQRHYTFDVVPFNNVS